MLFENIKTIENEVQKMKHTEHILNFRDLKNRKMSEKEIKWTKNE